MRFRSNFLYCLAGIVAVLLVADSCKHDPIPSPVHVHDTVVSRSHVYVFKDTLNTSGTGGKYTPVYGSSGDTIKDSVCFAEQILPLFESHCAKTKGGCHDDATQQDGYAYTSYSKIRGYVTPGSPTTGKTMSRIISGRMPPSSSPPLLTSAETALIERWIREGAKNNIDCGFSCDTSKFTYSGQIAGIISANCVGCHNSSSKGGGYDFTTYSGLVASITAGKLIGAVTQLSGYYPMPVGSKLSACNIALIRQWVNAGYLNN